MSWFTPIATSGNAIQLGGLGGAVTIAGGVRVGGTVTASAAKADATALRFGAGATTPILSVAGTLQAAASATEAVNVRAVQVDAGGQLPAISNGGVITASITGGSICLPANVYTLDSPLSDATTVQALTQELRVAGGTDTFDWLIGAFYSDMDRDYGQSLFVGGFEALTGIPTEGNFGADTDILFFSDLAYEFQQMALFDSRTRHEERGPGD